FFNQVIAQDRIDRRGTLKHSIHSTHPAKQLAREARLSEEMIVEKIQMPSRQPRDFCQRVIDKLRIESASALEERVFVTEGAVVRAAARNDDRVRNQVGMSLNQITANRRDSFQSPHRRLVPTTRFP